MGDRIGTLRKLLAALLVLAAVILVLSVRTGRFEGIAGDAPAPSAQDESTAAASLVATDPTLGSYDSRVHESLPTFTPAAPGAEGADTPPTVPPNKVGLIAGHWQYDSGAVCADGRREVDVTVDVAHRVEAILEVRGFDVEVIPEHEPDVPQPPLQGYDAAALVSLHADSCNVPGATGFKVARWPYSSTADADDRLVDCLYHEYAAETLMPRHDDSITQHMLGYYAFREVGVRTPAAIIELGFLGDDRSLMVNGRYNMAMGVANGISCFLRGG